MLFVPWLTDDPSSRETVISASDGVDVKGSSETVPSTGNAVFSKYKFNFIWSNHRKLKLQQQRIHITTPNTQIEREGKGNGYRHFDTQR